MAERLQGKVAIVTGGGRGLGRAMVLGLAKAGASVVAIAARERSEIELVAAAARAATGAERVLPLVADVTREEDCARVVAAAQQHFGALHIVVNNAGRGMKYASANFMTAPPHFWEVAPATWRLVIDTNVTGPFLMARAAAPHLIAQRWGRIINVSMGHETMRRQGFSPYGPSKAALESETIIWAQDLAGTGVSVNALLPGGATLTGMIPDAYPAALRAKLLDPDIMVPPLLYLASERADGVTGMRFNANRWRSGAAEADAALGACDNAGWPGG